MVKAHACSLIVTHCYKYAKVNHHDSNNHSHPVLSRWVALVIDITPEETLTGRTYETGRERGSKIIGIALRDC